MAAEPRVPAAAPPAVRRRAQPRRDPARGGAPGHRRRPRRAVARAPGRRGRHEQERTVRALPAPRRSCNSPRSTRRARSSTSWCIEPAGATGRRPAPVAGLHRAVPRPRRGGRLPRRVLLRLRRGRARHPSRPGPRRRDGLQPALARAARRRGRGGAGGRRARSRAPTRRRSRSSSTPSWSWATCSSSPAAGPRPSTRCARRSTAGWPVCGPDQPDDRARRLRAGVGAAGLSRAHS